MNTIINRIEIINEILHAEDAPFEAVHHSVFKPDGLHEGIGFKSEAYNATPILYINPQIEAMDDLTLASYLRAFFGLHAKNIPSELYAEHENILSEILPRLCSAEHIDDMKLQDIAYIPFLDLMVYFYLPLPVVMPDDIQGSIQVTNTMLQNAFISVDEAFEASRRNIADAYEIKNLADLIIEMMGGTFEVEDVKMPMWVATNKSRVNGASVILNEHVLSELEQRLGTFYICPSSIHEVICISCRDCRADELANIVHEVNATEVPSTDVLSDSVYICKNGILGIAIK